MISFKTLTYGRTHLLTEALQSFLIQDYPESGREMVIVNDYPLQKLVFDHPRVKIYNLDETFDVIGDKENFAIEHCLGDLIVTADDDDIALSNHCQNIVKYWKKDTNILFWARAAFYNEPDITAITSVGNSGFVFSKKVWEQVGRSPHLNAGGDMQFVNNIRAYDPFKVINADPINEEISWFYRWSLPECYHQSGMGTDTPDRKNVVQRNSEYIESLRKQGKIPTGIIQLTPHWRHDYQQMLEKYITS